MKFFAVYEVFLIIAYGVAVAQAASDGASFLFLALPLAIYMMRKIRPLVDGDEPPFGK